MAGLSDYAELKLIDHILSTTPLTMPAQTYLGLFLTAPSDAGGGTEISGNGYARQAINFGAAAAGQAASSDAPVFGASGGNWGTVTHFALFDALTTGNMLGWAPMTVERVVNNGDTLTFSIGDIIFTLD